MIRTISQYLGVDVKVFEKLKVFDAFIDIDTKFFLDPYYLKNTDIPEFNNSRNKIIKYYEDIITLLSNSQTEGDIAWKEAGKRLFFRELKGVSLGYGDDSNDGTGIGPILAKRLIRRASEIVKMGVKDPEIFELIGLFEEDFGADRLSDMTINIITEDVLAYSQRITEELKVENIPFYYKKFKQKTYKLFLHPKGRKPIIFLPREFLRPLPIATSWEDIGSAAAVNQDLRERLNTLIGEIWKYRNKQPKRHAREIVLSDVDNLKAVIDSYKSAEISEYDYESDPDKEISWHKWGQKLAEEHKLDLQLAANPTIDDVEGVVRQIVMQFKKNIEVNGANILLFVEKNGRTKPAHERYSQRLFFSTADSYCAANDLDLSPEVNSGSGSVDFKISKGYTRRVLVEIKLSSSSRTYDGYVSQLDAYQQSELTDRSFYVIIRVSETINQIKRIQTLHQLSIEQGKRVPNLIIIDALVKPSASKR